MSTLHLLFSDCDRRRGGRCRGLPRKRTAPPDQLALFSPRPGPCPTNAQACGDATAGGIASHVRCRSLMCEQLIVPVQDPFIDPKSRLEGVTAIVVEGPEGRPLILVTDAGLRRMYRNITDRGARNSKKERQRSERMLDERVARLEGRSWFFLRLSAERWASRGRS